MLLAAIGDLVLDITIAPHGELRTNDDTPASIRVGGGGQAANFCAWVAAQGERSRLITRVGDDDAGRRLVSELEAGGVEVHAVRASGRASVSGHSAAIWAYLKPRCGG